jgi:FkbM family methyltransferase
MKKIGNFWVPDTDTTPGRNLQNTIRSFDGGEGIQISNLERALSFVPGRILAIDGGANVGSWTKRLGTEFEAVHSFEPNPDVYACLKRNIAEWKLPASVHIYQKGLSNERSFMGIQIKEGARTVTGRLSGHGDIECLPLDELALPNCSFLKLDLEGHEAKAIDGARRLIERFHPWILIENKPKWHHRAFFGTPPDHKLKALGYQLVERIGERGIDWLYRPRG